MRDYFIFEPQAMAYHSSHDHIVVLFSLIIAFFASVVSLDLVSQIESVSRLRRAWIGLGAVTLGGGIWAMHFVGMMALRIDVAIGYEFWTTLLSFMVAVVFVGVALLLVCECRRSFKVTTMVGLFLGSGIAAMHYLGMAAIRGEVEIAYRPGLFALSIAVALGAATFAMWISGGLAAGNNDNVIFRKAAAALAMTLAIPGMHYTGIAATVFLPAPGLSDPAAYMGAKLLLFPVAGFSLFIFGISYSVSAYHKGQTQAIQRQHDRLAEAHLFLRQLMVSLPAPIFFRDMEGRYIAVNLPFERLFGLEGGAVEGKTALELGDIGGGALRELDRQARECMENGQGQFETSVTRPDGATRDFMVTVSLFHGKDGKPAGSAGAMVDLSEMKFIHRQLSLAHDEAKAATKLKDQFVNLVSHDLRSPLSSIKMMVNLLGHGSLPEEKKEEILQRLRLVADGMVMLIDQLLDISRLQTGVILPKKRLVHIRPFVGDLIENIRPQAERKGVAVFNEVPDDYQVFADRALFGEVVANLLANGVKFTRKGDRINVLPSPEGGLIVADTGVGVEPEILPNLFRAEVKTSMPGTAGEKGTGLGLPYCQDIMKAHGGSITVESTPGQGSRFHLILPEMRPLIMLVDDQPGQRELMKRVINESYQVDYLEAENGADAMAVLEDHMPSLIISDVHMNQMDGFNFLTRVKENSGLREIPVIIATSSSSSSSQESIDMRKKAFDLGADDYVTKPVSKSDFLPRLHKLLHRG